MATRSLRSKSASKAVNSTIHCGSDERPASKRVKRSSDEPTTQVQASLVIQDDSDANVKGGGSVPKETNTNSDSHTNNDGNDDEQSDPQKTSTLKVIEEIGDIFDAPDNTLLIHACNCEGHWGAGIAKAFHDLYPKAYIAYADHCDDYDHALFGKAQLIKPMDVGKKHFVGCLYTSRSMGRKKDSPARILGATKPAMLDLLQKVNEWNAKLEDEDGRIGEVRICQINSGLFAVPWVKTKAVLESIDVSAFDVKEMKVLSRE